MCAVALWMLSLAGEYGAAIAKGYESRNDYTSEIQRVD